MGHDTSPNIYTERYPASGAADQFGNTSLPRAAEEASHPFKRLTSEAQVVEGHFAANTSVASVFVVAPCTGRLVGGTVTPSVTSTGTATYTFKVENESNSSADMVPSIIYDADPVITASTATEVTLSTTAADLLVDVGDQIAVEMTGGTGSGTLEFTLMFMANN